MSRGAPGCPKSTCRHPRDENGLERLSPCADLPERERREKEKRRMGVNEGGESKRPPPSRPLILFLMSISKFDESDFGVTGHDQAHFHGDDVAVSPFSQPDTRATHPSFPAIGAAGHSQRS